MIGPLINELRSQTQKAGLPDNVFGVIEGSNVTGFAENTLLAAAKDRIQPYIDGTSAFFADCIELGAYLYHGFGHLYVENSATGEYRVPSRSRNPYPGQQGIGPMPPVFQMQSAGMQPDQIAGEVQAQAPQNGMMPGQPGPQMPGPPHIDDPEVAITRETFDLVGFRPKVTLESFDWNAMTQRANVAQMLTQPGVEIWSKYTARDKLGVENPDQEGRWITVEKAQASPLVQPMMILHALWESGNIDGFMAVSAQLMGPQGQPGQPPQDPNQAGGTVRGVQTVQGDSQPSVDPTNGPGRPGLAPGPGSTSVPQGGGNVGP